MTNKVERVQRGIEFDHLEAEKDVPGLDGWTINVQVRADADQKPYVSRVTLEVSSDAPAAPLTTAAWRSLPIGALTDTAIAKYRELEPAIWKALPAHARIQHDGWRKADGPHGHPDERYAALAAAFVGRVQGGSRKPLADVAKTMGCPPSTANARLRTARKRGLLSGYELTAKALALLGQSDDPKARSDAPLTVAAPWICGACNSISWSVERPDACVNCGERAALRRSTSA